MITESRKKELHSFESLIGYQFSDITLLDLAFFHSSYANENKKVHNKSNERLEFLGDAVLDLIISDLLYRQKPRIPEGEMTKLRSKMVCEKSFANIAEQFRFGDYLLMGKGEEKNGGRQRPAILADTFEAVCGAIYLDSGYESIFKVIDRTFKNLFMSEIQQSTSFTDYKTILQEFSQSRTKNKIKYRLTKEEGPDHDKVFFIDVYEGDLYLGSGVGKSKKRAEQIAAKDALKRLGKVYES